MMSQMYWSTSQSSDEIDIMIFTKKAQVYTVDLNGEWHARRLNLESVFTLEVEICYNNTVGL